ncbi:hypothetical protein G6F59_015637 [Rhizopus arrhizus]|nr:hypothetical protein G6F59_015637 [Rhizopus arrhizus]
MMTGQRPATFQVAVVVQAHRALGIGKIALDDAGLADAEQAGAAGRAAADVVAPCRAGGQRSFPALARLQRGQTRASSRRAGRKSGWAASSASYSLAARRWLPATRARPPCA